MLKTELKYIALLCFSTILIIACNETKPLSPTWHNQIKTIIDNRCGECHSPNGVGGIVFNEQSAPALIGQIISAIASKQMPPWPPGPESMPLINTREVLPNEFELLQKWESIGSPIGDPTIDTLDNNQYKSHEPEANLRLRMRKPYNAPMTGESDTFRCFLLDTEPLHIRGYSWAIQDTTRRASHHVAAAVPTSIGRSAAIKLDYMDGFPGWNCPMGFGDGVEISATLGTSGVGYGSGSWFPDGSAIDAPAGLIFQMHYLPTLLTIPDQSGVDIWLAQENLNPVREWLIAAPVELPCPNDTTHGYLMAPHPCSRDRALRDTTSLLSLDELRQNDDVILNACNKNYAGYMTDIDWTQGPDRFIVKTSCEMPAPFSGRILTIHPHAHTRAVSAHVEIQQDNGSWISLLDIPHWRWVWESPYSLVTPVQIKRNQHVRVSCVFDNGNTNQWGALSGPGHDAPAIPPLETPAFRVSGPRRIDEMCGATFQWTQ